MSVLISISVQLSLYERGRKDEETKMQIFISLSRREITLTQPVSYFLFIFHFRK